MDEEFQLKVHNIKTRAFDTLQKTELYKYL